MKIISTLLVAIFCSVQPAAGAFLNPAYGNAETFFPPCNLEGEDIGFAAELIWRAPGTCEPDSLPVETAGFRIYRDEIMIAETDGETFSYTDYDYQGYGYLIPGSYSYTITALYMVDGDLVESDHEGPVEVLILPGFGFISFVGFVVECYSNDPVAGASVLIGGCHATSNENGFFTCTVLQFDTLTGHVSAPGYCDTTFLVIWDPWFPFLNFCLMPCNISGSPDSEYKPDEINVFPVPAFDMLNISISEGIQRIMMYNYTGQVLLDNAVAGEQTMQIDVKSYHTGAYILQFITADGRTMNKRIIISR